MIQIGRAYSEEDPTVMLLIHENKGDMDNFNATLSFAPTIGIWSPQLTLMYLQQWYRVDMPGGIRKNFNNPVGYFTWNNHFGLPCGFMLDADFSLMTRGDQDNARQKTLGSIDFTLRKSFLDERLSLQLSARDLLNTNTYSGTIYSGDRLMTIDQQTRRTFTLTVRYKFNPSKSKYKGSGAGQEQRGRM